MQPAISIQGLQKSYGAKKAINNLSIEVAPGEVFGLLGHNGAGKTTTITCTLGIRKFQSGKIRILNMNPVKARKKLFERVGVQFQENSFQDKIKVSELCKITSASYKSPACWETLLNQFGLAEKRNSFVAELSGGEKQRLFVLLALIPSPDVVFLDELTTGLDSQARRDVWKFLKKLKEKGLTIFLTSHYMDEVEALCDRICILQNGGKLVEGTIPEVIAKTPCQTLEEAYLFLTEKEAV